LHQRYRLGAGPYDAHDNIIAGAAYLRELHDRYGAPAFLAAYNAGPARWEDHLATGRLLPMETQAYLARLAPVCRRQCTRRCGPAGLHRPFMDRGIPVCRTLDRVADRRSTRGEAAVAAPDERPSA